MPNGFDWTLIDEINTRQLGIERIRRGLYLQRSRFAYCDMLPSDLFYEQPKAKTVSEKIKEMWERSNYYKMMQSKAVKVEGKKKGKPYYRMFERW